MNERQEAQAFIETAEKLVHALMEQVSQKEHQCEVLTAQLADQMTRNAELNAQLSRHQTRQSVILFPKTPAT